MMLRSGNPKWSSDSARALAQALGLELVPSPADGNCFFWVVAAELGLTMQSVRDKAEAASANDEDKRRVRCRGRWFVPEDALATAKGVQRPILVMAIHGKGLGGILYDLQCKERPVRGVPNLRAVVDSGPILVFLDARNHCWGLYRMQSPPAAADGGQGADVRLDAHAGDDGVPVQPDDEGTRDCPIVV